MLNRNDRHNIALDLETKDKLKALAEQYNVSMNDAVSAMMAFCMTPGSINAFEIAMRTKREWREVINKDIWLAKTQKAREASMAKRKEVDDAARQ